MGLNRRFRLAKHENFSLVYKNGSKVDTIFFILYYMVPTDRNKGQRVGFTVTKKIGKAFIRNKIRRRLQEVIRQLLPGIIEPIDIVIVAKKNIIGVSYHDIADILEQCMNQLKLLKNSKVI